MAGMVVPFRVLALTLCACLGWWPPGGWATAAAAPAPGVLPVAGAPIVGAFDPPLVRWGAGHRGVDLAAAPGQSCLLYTSPSPRDGLLSRMPSSA